MNLTGRRAIMGELKNVKAGNKTITLSRIDEPSRESKKVSEEKIIPTFCHGCGAAKTRCGILCHVKDGEFIRVEGNPEAFNNWGYGCTSLCAKGNAAVQYEYSPNRLKYPMKRVGEKGEGKFQRITWDEALDTITVKHMRFFRRKCGRF
jgi:anaerobic selenocysteine-containing dehydrogenase